MTNKEFYWDKLLPVALENACGRLHRIVHGESCFEKKECKDCEFHTVENIENWLNAKYEEQPRLENGNDLKPGDWIMVRDGDADSWNKRQFLFYYNNMFYCASKGECVGRYVGVMDWQQARLPMEGERK